MASQWDQIAIRSNERMLLMAQESFVLAASKVIERSPVDEGLFRNNWFSGLNSPNEKTTDAKSKKPFGELGGARYQEALEVSSEMVLGDKAYFTNRLPYNFRLEYDSWSDMAPNGMVRITAAEWPSIVEKTARNIK